LFASTPFSPALFPSWMKNQKKTTEYVQVSKREIS
jgi:hypothetical protein